MRKILTATALGLALAGGLAASPLLAQGMGPDHGGGGPGGGPGGFGNPAQMCEGRDARTAGLLAYAETRLGITEAQRPAWDAFRRAVEASDAPMDQACAELANAGRAQSLPERMARMERFGEARLAQLKALRPAVETLYAQLTPEQRQTADGLMSRGWHRHRNG